MTKKKSPPDQKAFANPGATRRACGVGDYFCQSANEIDELAKTDEATARLRWDALRESASTDDSGDSPPTLFNAAKISLNIKHSLIVLLKAKIFLSIRECHELGRSMPELSKALPSAPESYQRTFKDRFFRIHHRWPFNCGTDSRNRFAITYAEFLHLEGVPGIDLTEGLDQDLRERLEAL